MKGIVLPRRWVVERTFSWFGRNRRLAKDFENLAETLATLVTLASIQLALASKILISASPEKRSGPSKNARAVLRHARRHQSADPSMFSAGN
jgi:hypothetical protein